MRKMFEPQLPLLQRWIDKPHALEYKLMSQVLDDACDAVQAVYACLMRQGQRADRGRATLTAEQVLRILVVKQLENLSYEQLEFALADSSTFRTFCRLPQGLTPTKSVLHRCLKGLDEACLQLVHQAVLSVGLNDGIESGYPLRQPRSSHHEAPYLRCPHGKASQHTSSPIPYPRSSSTTAPLPSRFAPSQPNPLVNDETQDQSLSPAPNQYT